VAIFRLVKQRIRAHRFAACLVDDSGLLARPVILGVGRHFYYIGLIAGVIYARCAKSLTTIAPAGGCYRMQPIGVVNEDCTSTNQGTRYTRETTHGT